MGPQFAQLPEELRFSDLPRKTGFTRKGYRFFGDIVSVRHILYIKNILYTEKLLCTSIDD
jgi:hypothetical protein